MPLNSKSSSTPCIRVMPENLTTPEAQAAIARAAEILRAGGTVVFPTETVYGLGANALDANAVARIFTAKERPAWDPLIVHVATHEMLSRVVAEVSTNARKLMDTFWPGPLTLLLPRADVIPNAVTAGRDLVGVRMPVHPVAHALIAAANLPIAAPSANRFGHTSPTMAQHVLDDLNGRIDLVIDGGPTERGVESTVVEVAADGILLYRPGAVSIEQLEAVAGPVRIFQLAETARNIAPQSLPSPGVGIRHYAPRARVTAVDLAELEGDALTAVWLRAVSDRTEGSRTGAMRPTGWPMPENFSGAEFAWGNWHNDSELARRLFAGLRALDDQGVDCILCPLPSRRGLGAAIRDRVLKAARRK